MSFRQVPVTPLTQTDERFEALKEKALAVNPGLTEREFDRIVRELRLDQRGSFPPRPSQRPEAVAVRVVPKSWEPDKVRRMAPARRFTVEFRWATGRYAGKRLTDRTHRKLVFRQVPVGFDRDGHLKKAPAHDHSACELELRSMAEYRRIERLRVGRKVS